LEKTFKRKWATARRAQQPFASFVELAYSLGGSGAKVGLEDVHGICQDAQGQLF
jgi:hypothetical protein